MKVTKINQNSCTISRLSERGHSPASPPAGASGKIFAEELCVSPAAGKGDTAERRGLQAV